MADFRGKSIVVFAASPWAPFIDLWLKSGGLTRETATIMFVDPAALFGTYTAGRADGLMSILGSALPVAQKARPIESADGQRRRDQPSQLWAGGDRYGAAIEARRPAAAWSKYSSAPGRGSATAIWTTGVAAMLKQRPDARLDPDHPA